MTCPNCRATVSRWAFLTASGLSGIVCDACGTRLNATFESRLRLTAGGIVLGSCVGGLLRSLGFDGWVALVLGSVALCAWFYARTEAILVLQPAQASVPSIL